MNSQIKQPPKAVGLYDPRFEHDACGVGMVARLDNTPTHEVITRAITALENLEHRGASGADPCTGDGAGILMQMPDELLRSVVSFELPPLGQYGVLMCFLPTDAGARARLEGLLERIVLAEDQRLLGWRDVPVEQEHTGEVAGACRPVIRQLFVGAGAAVENDRDAFERKLYVIRRISDLTAEEPGLYVVSSSSRTLNYKGMLISYQLAQFYTDLRDERTKSALALVHSRFSTNTFPSWELAHPYRVICHNGEINTVMGNVNWMRARESELRSELFGEDLEKILPVVTPGNSDSATFDNVLELLMLAGRSLPHAAMMMIPEAYRNREDLPEYLKGFYAFHSCLMEPWDGPASVAFTDGRVVGATLDRNGLRPGRWVETTDGYVVLGSESGLLDIPPEQVRRLGRLQPGKLFLVDLERGRIVEDEEVKREVATRRPYGEWFVRNAVPFAELPPSEQVTLSNQPLHLRQRAFGYSQEDLRVLLAPMAIDGAEPVGSMGNDLSLAVLSDQAPPLFSYFKQLFAQVTNPPIDPIREEIVMSLATSLGTERNLFEETPEHAHKLLLDQPILLNRELETLRHVDHEVYAARTIDITWPTVEGPTGMSDAIERICRQAREAIAEGVNIIILSDRQLGPRRAAIPSLLAVAAVHHHLVLERTRLRAGIIVESGEPREVHHFATLIGFGASAVNPYLMLETLDTMVAEGRITRAAVDGEAQPLGAEEAAQNVDQGDRQRASEDDLQDGHLDDPVLPRRADLRGGRPREGARRHALHLHRLTHRRRWTGGARDRGARAPRARVSGLAGSAAAGRRGLRMAARRRASHVEPGDDRARTARRACGKRRRWRCPEGRPCRARGRAREPGVREVPRVRADGQRGCRAPGDVAWPAADRRRSRRRPTADRPRGGRAGERDRQALLHRRDEPRLDLARGARDAGDRHEPPRRALEHRRGWGGPRALPTRRQRRPATLGDQAGRIGSLRRDDPLPRQRRRAADQDGPGRQAGRGRSAAGAQGRRLHRLDPPHHARRRPDLSAAAPRHLLDRGPQAADLRPALLQPAARRCRSSSSPRSASARSPPACPRRTPTAC